VASRALSARFFAIAVCLAPLALACRGGSPPAGPPAPEPSSSSRVQAAAHSAPAVLDDPFVAVGLPPVAVVLDDPLLASARALDREGSEAAAAHEVDRVRMGASLERERACEFAFVAGRLHMETASYDDAAAAFDAAAARDGATCRLADQARLRQAEALVRAGHGEAALAALEGAGELRATDEERLVAADAHVVKGDRAGAVALWRGLLAGSPRGLRWVDTSIQLARALLDGVDGPAESRAAEALELATRVVVEAPWVADKVDAPAVRARAASALHRASVLPLSIDERARQAQAFLDESQPKKARTIADGVLAAVPPGSKDHADAACKAATVRARATPHGRADAIADAWGIAAERCRDDDALATALYQGARASATAGRSAEALARFGEVEKRFATHRLADDARFRAALIVADQGDVPRSLAMLGSIADTYPDGDMGGDALFRVFLEKLDQRDLEGARAVLDRLLAMPADALGWGSVCRAEYFRARVAEMKGDLDGAKARYVNLVSGRPLSYYMLLAHARLLRLDRSLAQATLEAAVRSEPGGPFFTRPHPELASSSFARFVALLEVGDLDAARREAGVAGLLSDGSDPEVVWAVASVFDRAGAPEIGHSFARARLVDYRAHWPVGRWRVAWEIAFPRPFVDAVARESEAARIPAPLTWAIMREESAFNPDARSSANALGLMQLMSNTARLIAKGTTFAWDDDALRRPDVSIALGARLLSSLRTAFPSRPALAIAAYNGGSAAVRRWWSERGNDDFDVFVEHIGFDETRNYVKRVLASQAAYGFLYAPGTLDELYSLVAEPDPGAARVAGAAAPVPALPVGL
jgi:soluble lytic murein transglycosylase